VFLFISTLQLIQSWHVHHQFQLSREKFTLAQPSKRFKLRTTQTNKQTIQDEELANGIPRKKPFKSKYPCQVHLGTGMRFGMNLDDGTAIDPPKVAVYLNKMTDHVYL
jgi:hypothetical protein